MTDQSSRTACGFAVFVALLVVPLLRGRRTVSAVMASLQPSLSATATSWTARSIPELIPTIHVQRRHR